MQGTARAILSRMPGVLLGFAAAAAVLWAVDTPRLLEVAGRADPVALALLALLYVTTWVQRGLRWRAMAADLGDPLPAGWAVAASTAGNALNILLPAKTGDLLWANAARARFGIPFLRAAVGVLAGRMVDLGVLVALGLSGAAALPALPLPIRVGAGVVACLSLVAWAPAARLARWAAARPGRRAPFRLATHAVTLLTAHRAWRHLLSTAAIWLLEGGVAWGVAATLQLPVGPAGAMLAVMVANLSKILPLTPASLGTYEAAGAAVLVPLGVPFSDGVAFCLVEHGLKLCVNVALALPSLALADLPLASVDRAALRRAWKAGLRADGGT